MRIAYNENVSLFYTYNTQMSISELKARFRGFRRREEELEEAKLVEHNRNVSELFASLFFIQLFIIAVRQNMRIYEKKMSDAVTMVLELGQYMIQSLYNN